MNTDEQMQTDFLARRGRSPISADLGNAEVAGGGSFPRLSLIACAIYLKQFADDFVTVITPNPSEINSR
jgi:hypothetical protein